MELFCNDEPFSDEFRLYKPDERCPLLSNEDCSSCTQKIHFKLPKSKGKDKVHIVTLATSAVLSPQTGPAIWHTT